MMVSELTYDLHHASPNVLLNKFKNMFIRKPLKIVYKTRDIVINNRHHTFYNAFSKFSSQWDDMQSDSNFIETNPNTNLESCGHSTLAQHGQFQAEPTGMSRMTHRIWTSCPPYPTPPDPLVGPMPLLKGSSPYCWFQAKFFQ